MMEEKNILLLEKNFIVSNQKLSDASKVIVPISPGKTYKHFFTKNKLNALLKHLDNCEVTILIADSLQKYNIGEEEALKNGEEFLNDHQDLLSLPQVKQVKRWHEWIQDHQKKFDEFIKLINEKDQPGTNLQNSLLLTAKKSASNTDTNQSKMLLKEENAVYLTYHEYDYHYYPRKISDSFAELYKDNDFKKIKKPKYIEIKYKETFAQKLKKNGLFEDIKEENSLPFPLRMLYENLEKSLTTSEISAKKRRLFIQQAQNLLSTIASTLDNEVGSQVAFVNSRDFIEKT